MATNEKLNTLTTRRKADRKIMADIIQAVVEKHGAKVTRTEEGEDKYYPRAIQLDIEEPKHQLGVYIKFDGKSPHANPNTWVVPWCIRSYRQALLSDRFGRYQGASVNHSKCMPVKYTFTQLLDAVETALEMAADGSAFKPYEE